MPATIPPKPAAGAMVDAAWGTDVHDRIYTPRGVIVNGGVAVGVGSAATRLPLTTVLYGRAAMLDVAGNRIRIDSGGSGLYAVEAFGTLNNIAAGGFNRIAIFGGNDDGAAPQIAGTSPQPGGSTSVFWSASGIVVLADFQVVYVTALAVGADIGDFGVSRLSVHRIGNALA